MSAITMAAWRRALLLHRMDELADIKLAVFADSGAVTYRTPTCVQEILRSAVLFLKAGNLDETEKLCRAAEHGLLRTRRDFEALLAARELQPLANDKVR